MNQSKTHSMVETFASTAVGFGIAVLISYFVLPFWGYNPSPGQAIEITVVFTIASLIRGYGMRRIFNWLGLGVAKSKTMDAFQEEAALWARITFPSATLQNRSAHLMSELGEIEEDPTDTVEWSDVYLLFQQAAYEEGHSMSTIFQTAQMKQEINKKRKWGKANEHGFVEHIKDEDHD